MEAKDTVLAFLKALNAEAFGEARDLVATDFVFEGVLGSRNGPDAYFDDMRKMKLKYDVKKVLGDQTDVAVFYDIDMGGKTIFSAGWYAVSQDKITRLRVVFDPRPVLG
jgi:hypothetical protein